MNEITFEFSCLFLKRKEIFESHNIFHSYQLYLFVINGII